MVRHMELFLPRTTFLDGDLGSEKDSSLVQDLFLPRTTFLDGNLGSEKDSSLVGEIASHIK